MAVPTLTESRPFDSLDDRITRALASLRQARQLAGRHPTPDMLGAEARAEENLNALLDYRSALRQRAGSAGAR